ncbi:MAG: N-acetylmuramoyl-L-alanine amidase, partial [Candidatus Microthrix parvicella]
MCGIRDCDHSEPSTVGRRKFLGAAAAAPLAMAPSMLGIPDAVASSSGLVTPARRFGRVDMPEIRRRTDWAPDLPVRKPIEAEDVKFLLVHHTADPDSNYQPDDVVGMLRKIYDYHTGAEKDWPDIAYNFFVDKFGRIWESRTGSVDSPLRGDATGGNQGFSQLCCFLGDFEAEQPPQEAVMSMIALLTWLADKHGLNMTPGATTTFTSRGSNKWPEGSEITTQTISTHRQMSETTCPGTACHELVTTRFQQMVSDQLPTKAPATT